MDQEDQEHESRRGKLYHVRHVWNKLLLNDDSHLKTSYITRNIDSTYRSCYS